MVQLPQNGIEISSVADFFSWGTKSMFCCSEENHGRTFHHLSCFSWSVAWSLSVKGKWLVIFSNLFLDITCGTSFYLLPVSQ